MEENTQGGGSKRIYIAIIALLLLINGIAGVLLYINNNKKQDQIEQNDKQKVEIKGLTQQLDSANQVLESMKGKNSELDSIVTARQALIDETKAQLEAAKKRGNMNAAEVAKYKDIIAKFQADNADLQKKIQELTAKNQELTAKNLEVTQNLVEEKNTTAALSKDKEDLSKKVALGSLLQLQNVKVEGMKKKKNGKEEVEKKAKKTEYLKISFATGENKVLEKGPLSLYVRIINPKGETIALGDQGSGTTKIADGGGEVQYSRKVDMDWDQTSKNEIVEWSQNIKDPGTYKVEIYQAGHMVGKGQVDLK